MDKRNSFSVDVRIISLISLAAGSLLITGCVSIHTAAGAGNVSQVKKQLAWGVNPNTRTFWMLNTPLIKAAAYGRVEVVKSLPSRGADPRIRASYGRTVLHEAAFNNNVEIGRILLAHGVDPTAEFNGRPVPEEFVRSLGRPATAVHE